MPITKDRHNPSFVLFPVNNNRTGWRPFGLPVVLVVPHRTSLTGGNIPNSQIFNLKIYIEDVPRNALVVGHDNIGLRFPDRELFSVTIDAIELAERRINLDDYEYSRNGNAITYQQAALDDSIHYTTRSGIRDTINFIPDAFYYDLSDITIDFEHLPPDNYNLVYEVEYFSRLVTQDDRNEFICISSKTIAISLLRFNVKHPGAVIEEFERHTPPPYLSNAERSNDTTLALYRPFTDILEDIYDEQQLLESINWVYDTPPEVIPYLSQLLGWDLPYFPQSLDKLRKAVLRRTVELQQASGTRLAIINLFRLFGFEILINNLWWSSDGQRLIRPDEKLPFGYEQEEIKTQEITQIDSLITDWSNEDYDIYQIPLLYRPQTKSDINQYSSLRDGGDITINCYVVDEGSQAYNILKDISQDIYNNPSTYGRDGDNSNVDRDGHFIVNSIDGRLAGTQITQFSQVLISGKLGLANKTNTNIKGPISENNISINRDSNILSLTLNGSRLKQNQKVFVFAIYKRFEFIVPNIISELQSNRFDIQVVTQELSESADPVFLEFAIEFLYKVKAFHSLLNKIILGVELNETYEVTDWCVGGDVTQRWDVDAGRLQVPPAILPLLPEDLSQCDNFDPKTLGYKESDILLRLRKLANLDEEFAAWKILDARSDQPIGPTRLGLPPTLGRNSCLYTHLGQDRIVGERLELRSREIGPSPNANHIQSGFSSNKQESPIDNINNGDFNTTGAASSSNNDSSIYGNITRQHTEVRQVWCEIDNSTDYCYKGRVDDELLYRPTVLHNEVVIFNPCRTNLGTGVYYTYPSYSILTIKGVSRPDKSSYSMRPSYSGGANKINQQLHIESVLGDYLTVPYDKKLNYDSMLSRLLRDISTPDDYTLHYVSEAKDQYEQQFNIALARPSLNIIKPTLHFPGCRFARLNALKEDFFHAEWRARPWDDDFSTMCGPKYICGDNEPSFLMYQMIVKEDGNEYLVYDDIPYQALGNGLIPDISSLGEHIVDEQDFRHSDIIHEVYMLNSSNSHECLQLDSVSDYDTSVITNGPDHGIISIDNAIFSSYANCGSELIDFADGYASAKGYLAYDKIDIGRDGLYTQLLKDLQMTIPDITDTPAAMLFYLNSGIRDEPGVRLDCGCLLVQCENQTEDYIDNSAICGIELYKDSLGQYDWSPDQLTVQPVMKLNENLGVSSLNLDGSIPSLLELI